MAKDPSVTRVKKAVYSKLALSPAEGSVVKAVHDLLLANRGAAVHYDDLKKVPGVGGYSHLSSLRQYLATFYGLDIRSVRHAEWRPVGRKRSRAAWLLAGEQVGRGYIDYVVKR